MTIRLLLLILCFAPILILGQQIGFEANGKSTATSELPKHLSLLFKIHQTVDTVILGDMNGDHLIDTAIIYSPYFAYPHIRNSHIGGCEDDSCLTQVVFSFSNVVLKHSGALGFQQFFTIEDLDGNGIKEVGFVPFWFHSCWQGLFIYGLAEKNWKQLASGGVYACSKEDFSNRVRKIDHNHFSVRFDKMDPEEWKMDTIVTYDLN